jgi:uncharacterized lipoprotein YajG
MKKILVVLVSSFILFSCSQEKQEVKVTPIEVSQSDLVKVCDSLIFNGNTKIKIKLDNVKVDGRPMKLDAECEISLERN